LQCCCQLLLFSLILPLLQLLSQPFNLREQAHLACSSSSSIRVQNTFKERTEWLTPQPCFAA
jgi:hypothetical protein